MPITRYAGVLCLTLVCATAFAQSSATNQAASPVNRLSVRYRSTQSYRHTATLTYGTVNAVVSLAVQRPNQYSLEVSGGLPEMFVQCDGSNVITFRPDCKQFSKTKAPSSFTRSDILRGIDVPSPAAKLISMLMQSNVRQSKDPLAQNLLAATSSKWSDGDKLQCAYDKGRTLQIYVSSRDGLIRRVTLLKGDSVVIDEMFDKVDADKPIPADTFARTLPEGGFEMVKNLPVYPMPTLTAGPLAIDFTLKTADDNTVVLSKLHDKVVLLFFMFDG